METESWIDNKEGLHGLYFMEGRTCFITAFLYNCAFTNIVCLKPTICLGFLYNRRVCLNLFRTDLKFCLMF